MPQRKNLLAILITGLLLSTACWGQEVKYANVSYTATPFLQFVKEMESKFDCHFYFNPVETDSLFINVTLEHATLYNILQVASKENGWHFSIDQQNRVYVSTGWLLTTQLAKDFFNRNPKSADSNNLTEPLLL